MGEGKGRGRGGGGVGVKGKGLSFFSHPPPDFVSVWLQGVMGTVMGTAIEQGRVAPIPEPENDKCSLTLSQNKKTNSSLNHVSR